MVHCTLSYDITRFYHWHCNRIARLVHVISSTQPTRYTLSGFWIFLQGPFITISKSIKFMLVSILFYSMEVVHPSTYDCQFSRKKIDLEDSRFSFVLAFFILVGLIICGVDSFSHNVNEMSN